MDNKDRIPAPNDTRSNISPYTNISDNTPRPATRPVLPDVKMPEKEQPSQNVKPADATRPEGKASISPVVCDHIISENVNPLAENILAGNTEIKANVSPAKSNIAPAADHKCPDIPFMPKNPQFGMAYVPYQKFNKTFTPEEALRYGTAFPDLHQPWSPRSKPYMCGSKNYYGGDQRG